MHFYTQRTLHRGLANPLSYWMCLRFFFFFFFFWQIAKKLLSRIKENSAFRSDAFYLPRRIDVLCEVLVCFGIDKT